MTRPNRHRIRRQIVELAVGAADQGPAVHHELARPFWDRAVPELEQVFDRAAGPDELLRLDRLELDLGTVGGGDWPAQFRRKLIAELTRSLAQFTPASESAADAGGDGPAEGWRQFLFYLAHGRLPWWTTTLRRRWIEIVAKGSDAEWSALREMVSSDPRARARLVHSVDDEFLEGAIARWAGVLDAARVLEHLTPARPGTDAWRRWRRGFWIMLLEWTAAGGFRSPRGGLQLARDLMTLRAMCEADGAPSVHFGSSLPDDSDRGAGNGPVELDLPEQWREWFLSLRDAAPFERAATPPRLDAGTPMDAAPAQAAARAAAPAKTARGADDEAIYLDGAGVILVHPFLEQLFRERRLLAGKTFRGLEAREQAVRLVGAITFGRVTVPEHELVLAKVLCGAALDDPIEPVPLEDEDVAACDALLRAVLTHWTTLRSSSPEWLREQFFLREGKLEDVDAGRRLTIERRAQDVLLARLPWGFGVVGLPWLTDRLFVHWLE